MKDAFLIFNGDCVGGFPQFIASLQNRRLAGLSLSSKPERLAQVQEFIRRDPTHPAVRLEHMQLVPNNLNAILSTVVELSKNYRIRGATTIGDEFVGPLAIVADLFGLKSPGLRASRVVGIRWSKG